MNPSDWFESLLAHYGYWVIFLALFLNNLGLPLPGTTIFLGAGFLVGKGALSPWATIAAGTAGCFLGSNAGYWLGLSFGRPLLKKIRWLHVTPKRIKLAERFSEKYGAKTVFFARFVALLHPVIGLLAGMGKTPLGPFLFFNLAGATAYSVLYTLAGKFLGQRWGLLRIWMGHLAFYVILLVIALFILAFFWRRAIIDFFSKKHLPTKG